MNRGQPMRTCGKRYRTEAAARCSKRGLKDGAMVLPCGLGEGACRPDADGAG